MLIQTETKVGFNEPNFSNDTLFDYQIKGTEGITE